MKSITQKSFRILRYNLNWKIWVETQNLENSVDEVLRTEGVSLTLAFISIVAPNVSKSHKIIWL